MSALRAVMLAAGLATLLAQAGCGGASDAAGGSDAASKAAPAVPATPATPAAPEADLATLDDIPTTDELETEMASKITEENADAEFEKLQKELEAEGDG